MSYRYSPLTRIAKTLYRKIRPVPRSPWTMGEVDDICAIHLVPPDVLVEFFGRCLTILKAAKGDDLGQYLEFGVFNGSSIGSMAKALEKANSSMPLFGFDAFEGLPAGAEDEDDGVWKKGFYACSYEQMQQCLKRREVDPDQITWINGWYDQTLTEETAETNNITNPGIVFIDCDTYSSSKAVLDFLAPRITRPVIICLDDWKLNDLDIKGMGEYRSFNEFLEANPHLTATEITSYNRKSKTFLLSPNK